MPFLFAQIFLNALCFRDFAGTRRGANSNSAVERNAELSCETIFVESKSKDKS